MDSSVPRLPDQDLPTGAEVSSASLKRNVGWFGMLVYATLLIRCLC